MVVISCNNMMLGIHNDCYKTHLDDICEVVSFEATWCRKILQAMDANQFAQYDPGIYTVPCTFINTTVDEYNARFRELLALLSGCDAASLTKYDSVKLAADAVDFELANELSVFGDGVLNCLFDAEVHTSMANPYILEIDNARRLLEVLTSPEMDISTASGFSQLAHLNLINWLRDRVAESDQ